MSETNNTEVMEQVTKEVQAIGETSKKNFEELNRNHEELKKLVDESEKKTDALLDEKINKMTQDIVTRQDMADNKKAIDDRLD